MVEVAFTMLFIFLVHAYNLMHIVENADRMFSYFRRCLVMMIVMEARACMLVDWPPAPVRAI
jgi:hypothetical protein